MVDFATATITHYFRGVTLDAQIGYDVVIAPTDDDLNRVARRLHRACGTRMDSSMSASWVLGETIARSGNFDGRHVQDFQGQGAGDGAVCSTAFLVSKIPVQGAPGRLYFPGVGELSVLASGALANNVQSNVQDDLNDWMDRIQNRGYQMVMRRPDGTLDPVQVLRLQPYVGRQDRRLQRSRRR